MLSDGAQTDTISSQYSTVLILVLLDYALRLFGILRTERSRIVLILVLLDYALRLDFVRVPKGISVGLNPCSAGLCSPTQTGQRRTSLRPGGLNPCSAGLCSPTEFKTACKGFIARS